MTRAVLLAWVVSATATAALPGWEPAALEAHRHELFDEYPPTVCALQALLGAEHARLLDAEYAGGDSGLDERVLGDADTQGGLVALRARFQTPAERLLWLHPDGRVLVAVAEPNSPVRIYASAPGLKAKPPPVVRAFLRHAKTLPERSRAPARWTVTPRPPEACADAPTREALAAYEPVRRGERCDAYAVRFGLFAGRPMVVSPRAGDRAALSREPLAGTPTEETSFVPAGHLVQVLTPAADPKGPACVYHRDLRGQWQVGWVTRDQLKPLPEDIGSVAALLAPFPSANAWIPSTLHRMSFPGRYVQDQRYRAALEVSLTGEGLSLSLRTNHAPISEGLSAALDGCSADETLRLMTARVAESDSDAEPAFRVYAFNNALWLEAPGFCDDQTFGGLYYANPPEPKAP